MSIFSRTKATFPFTMADREDSDSDTADTLAIYLYNKRRRKERRRRDLLGSWSVAGEGKYGQYHHLIESLFSYVHRALLVIQTGIIFYLDNQAFTYFIFLFLTHLDHRQIENALEDM
jgi:hypothetical protein